MIPRFVLYRNAVRRIKTCNVCICVCFQVVISSIHCTYIPTKLCVLLEDAKELAAWTALWNLSTVKIHTLFSPLYVLYIVCISV